MTILDRAQPYIPTLEAREITIRALAKILGCHECYLSRALQGHLNRVESSTKLRRKQAKLLESRKEMRQRHALLVKSGAKSLKKGAADARCSERTIRRYVANLS
jgi:AraC-like DNA-binding protein